MGNSGKNILIVEDEVLLAMDLELLLKEMGYGVTGCVITGEEALSAIERERPDLVLIDITLDGEMDGIETSRRIRQRHAVPVIFMTGNTDPDTLKRANESNPAGIVKKPLNTQDLRTVLQKAFL